MKPRAFIGSSVEGLPVAYAVQQNLLHDAEITVWSQGVFELSTTTIESLEAALAMTDFGIFVFSADDISLLRSEKVSAIRDNVLFEFGLFIGRVGRDRVYFLLPENATNLHIPTDLLGITPGKYEVGRSDGNLQSATGPASHQIRTQIQKLGIHPTRVSPPNEPESVATPVEDSRHWIFDFIDKKYSEAKLLIERELQTATGDDAINKQVWSIHCDIKINTQEGLKTLFSYAESHHESAVAICAVARILRIELYTDQALKLLNRSPSLMNQPAIQIEIAECHLANQEAELALAILDPGESNPTVAIKRSEILQQTGKVEEALVCVQRSYTAYPSNQDIRYRFAQLAKELDKNEIAAYLFSGLTVDYPNSVSYWGYLGNASLSLGLHDKALKSYRRAEGADVTTGPQQWITSNIGNLLNNKELPSEACTYLQRAIKETPSDYAYERLASAMKKAEMENKEFEKKCTEGLRQIRAMSAAIENPAA